MRNIHWISLIEENKSNVPKFVPITNNKPDPKVKIIQDYILEKTMSVMFSESNSVKDHEFFTNNASWDDFENHARMIAQFIEKKDQDKINKAIDKIKQAFITLGSFQDKDGKTDSVTKLNKGLDTINKIQTILKESGIEKNGSNDGVVPEIKIRHFLDLLQEDTWVTKDGPKIDSRRHAEVTHTKQYDISLFINMILGRKSRNLADKLSTQTTLGSILDSTIINSFKGKKEQAYELIRKIIRVDNYKKNGSNVGKAEIALALLFDDCSLPSTHGDICLKIGKESQAIELKAMNAAISNRTIRYPDLDMRRWSYIKTIKAKQPKGFDIKKIMKTINLKSPSITSDIGKAMTLIDKVKYPSKEGDEWKLATKFKLLFGALYLSYANGAVKTRTLKSGETKTTVKGGFDKMMFINTGDKNDAKLTGSDSPILTTPVVIVTPDKTADWY